MLSSRYYTLHVLSLMTIMVMASSHSQSRCVQQTKVEGYANGGECLLQQVIEIRSQGLNGASRHMPPFAHSVPATLCTAF